MSLEIFNNYNCNREPPIIIKRPSSEIEKEEPIRLDVFSQTPSSTSLGDCIALNHQENGISDRSITLQGDACTAAQLITKSLANQCLGNSNAELDEEKDIFFDAPSEITDEELSTLENLIECITQKLEQLRSIGGSSSPLMENERSLLQHLENNLQSTIRELTSRKKLQKAALSLKVETNGSNGPAPYAARITGIFLQLGAQSRSSAVALASLIQLFFTHFQDGMRLLQEDTVQNANALRGRAVELQESGLTGLQLSIVRVSRDLCASCFQFSAQHSQTVMNHIVQPIANDSANQGASAPASRVAGAFFSPYQIIRELVCNLYETVSEITSEGQDCACEVLGLARTGTVVAWRSCESSSQRLSTFARSIPQIGTVVALRVYESMAQLLSIFYRLLQFGFNRVTNTVNTTLVAISPDYEALNNNLEKLEKYLNLYGKIPFICMVSGFIRAKLGLMQIVGGLAYALFHLMLSPITIGLQENGKQITFARLKMDLAYCIHGLANILRASIEMSKITDLYIGRVLYDAIGLRLGYPTVPECLRYPSATSENSVADGAVQGLVQTGSEGASQSLAPAISLTNILQKIKDSLKDAINTLKTAVHPDYKAINETLAKLEKYLNLYGMIPFICVLSSLVRAKLGLIQIVGGLTYALFHLILFPITIIVRENGKEIALDRLKMDLTYCIHGLANILRASIEASMIGDLYLGRLVYDFSFRLEYPSPRENVEEQNLSPIADHSPIALS